MREPRSLVPGKLLLRATVGDGHGHGEASLFKLRGLDAGEGVLLSDVFTDKSHRRQKLAECAIASLIGQVAWRRWPVWTYVQAHGGGERPNNEMLRDFYLKVGFKLGPLRDDAGPLGQLLYWKPY